MSLSQEWNFPALIDGINRQLKVNHVDTASIRSGAYRTRRTRAYLAKSPGVFSPRVSRRRIRDTRELSRPLSYRRVAAKIPERSRSQGWLTPFSESAVRAVVTSVPACTGTRRARKRRGGRGSITSGGESQSIP